MPRMLNAVGRRRIARLQARLDWLNRRILAGQEGGKVFDYDQQEASALRWAIHIIEVVNDGSDESFAAGKKHGALGILKKFKGTLKKAQHSGNLDSLDYLTIWTDEKIAELEAAE